MVAFSPDDNRIIVGSHDGVLGVFVRKKQLLLEEALATGNFNILQAKLKSLPGGNKLVLPGLGAGGGGASAWGSSWGAEGGGVGGFLNAARLTEIMELLVSESDEDGMDGGEGRGGGSGFGRRGSPREGGRGRASPKRGSGGEAVEVDAKSPRSR